jgi:hypothetical protein
MCMRAWTMCGRATVVEVVVSDVVPVVVCDVVTVVVGDGFFMQDHNKVAAEVCQACCGVVTISQVS